MRIIKSIAWGCILIGLFGFLYDRYMGVGDLNGLYHIIPFFLVGVAMEAVYQEFVNIHKKLNK